MFHTQLVPRTEDNLQTSWNILLLASQNKLVSFPARKDIRSAVTILRDSIPFQDAVAKARSAFQTLRKSKMPREATDADASEQTAVSFSQLDLNNNVMSEERCEESTQGSHASDEATPQSEPVQTFKVPKKRRRSVIEHPLQQVLHVNRMYVVIYYYLQ